MAARRWGTTRRSHWPSAPQADRISTSAVVAETMSSDPTPTAEEIDALFGSNGTVTPLFTDDIADRTDYPVDATEEKLEELEVDQEFLRFEMPSGRPAWVPTARLRDALDDE